MSILYKVAIVGRVNVGKSTLFNKLISAKKAITSNIAGTTRDRNYAVCSWRDLDFYLVDTGGLERQSDDEIDEQISEQAIMAIKEADLVLFIVDTKNGLMPNDMELAKILKRQKKQTIVVANKADNLRIRQNIAEFYKLSLGDPWPVSAANGIGTGDLLDEVVTQLKKTQKKKSQAVKPNEKEIKVAMVGKPNVGKSSILNTLIGEKRLIVSKIPHTTRDSQDINFRYNGKNIVFIDTAGMRRQSQKKSQTFEKLSVEQTITSVKKSDIVILVTDVSKRLSWQDKHLIDEAIDAGTGIIILANKWDLIKDKDTDTIKEFEHYYQRFFPFIDWAPLVFVSAKEKLRIQKLLPMIEEIYQEKNKTISDNALDKLLKQIVKKHKPSRGKGTNQPYLYSLKQISTNPPRFALKMNFKADLHDSYLRFIENNLRYKFGFKGSPIKIRVIKSQNTKDIT